MVLVIASHLDVSLIAPGVAPRILNDIVVLSLLVGAETNGQHSMVEVLRVALRVEVNAFRVELERLLGCINGDGHRTDGCQSRLQFLLVALRDVDKALIGGSRILGVVTARVVLAFVRIEFLSVDAAVVLNVLEGVVHETAIATVVSVNGRAINEVLFGQRNQDTGFAEVLGLKRTGRRERPA